MNALLALQTNRRRLLTGGALAAAATAMPCLASAEGDLIKLADSTTVVLHDRRVPLAAETAARLQANGARILALTDDPVRMWRSEHGQLLARPDTRLLGVTRWSDFLMVSGLAAESRRRVRYQRLDNTGSAMVWLIA